MSRGGRWPASAIAVTVVLVVVLAVLGSRGGGSDGDATPPSSGPTSPTVEPDVTASPPAITTSSSVRDDIPTTSVAPPGSTGTTPVTSTTGGRDPASTARATLATLVVRPVGEPTAPYRRAEFMDDWDYDPATGCNTRERVLIAESTIKPTVDDRCRTTVGRWTSVYDGVVTTNPADLQIDHLIPLADAWRSGADRWTPDQRHRFANDLTSPDTLIAVTGRTNESKSDSSPDQWLPPNRSAWCGYAEAWVRVKARWHLSVTSPEASRLGDILRGC